MADVTIHELTQRLGTLLSDALTAADMDLGYVLILTDGDDAVAASNVHHPQLAELLAKLVAKIRKGFH